MKQRINTKSKGINKIAAKRESLTSLTAIPVNSSEVVQSRDKSPGDIKPVIFQQSKDQANQLSGSKSKCAFVLIFVDLFIFEVIEAPVLRVATHKRISGLTQVIFQETVAGVDKAGILPFKLAGLMFFPS